MYSGTCNDTYVCGFTSRSTNWCVSGATLAYTMFVYSCVCVCVHVCVPVVNHSCSPNVEVCFVSGDHTLSIVALEDINVGEV